MAKPPLYPLSAIMIAALLAGCFSGIDIRSPEGTSHLRVEDGKGGILYDGKGGEITLSEDVVRKLPTDHVVISTTRDGRTSVQTVRIDSGNISGEGQTDEIKWDAARGQYVTEEQGGMTQIDPPSLQVAEQPPAAPRNPTHIKVLNGAGEVLMDGAPGKDGRLAGSFDLARFDGKLVIRTTWDSGDPTDQTLVHDKGKPVDLGWNGREYFLKPTPQPTLVPTQPGAPGAPGTFKPMSASRLDDRLDLGLGWGAFKDKPPSVGVVVGPDSPLREGPGTVHFHNIDVAEPLERWGRFTPVLRFGAAWGDASREGEFSSGASGWAFQGGDSPGGSPGISTGAATRSSLKTDFDMYTGQLSLSDRFKDDDDSEAQSEISLALRRFTRDYRGFVEIPAVAGVSSTDKQQVKDWSFSLGYGLRGRHTFPNRVWLMGGIGLDAIYYDADYKGKHHYLCAPCGAADQDFTQTTRDDASGLTWGGWAQIGIGYTLSKKTELFARWTYRYQDDMPVLENRTAPGDPEPRLKTDSVDWSAYQIGLRMSF